MDLTHESSSPYGNTKKGWETFTDAIIQKLNDRKENFIIDEKSQFTETAIKKLIKHNKATYDKLTLLIKKLNRQKSTITPNIIPKQTKQRKQDKTKRIQR